ncbi:MAG: hypothetical protein KTR31_00900 [Myxococcales bacterium]|nr:hypothetical protein [Myxococcales bacterium]
MAVETFELSLSRHAFSPRDAARAGDVWRLFQDAAVIGSSRRGWPPQRYREARSAFVVRSMVVSHHREAAFGQPITARTWVSTFQRDMFSNRQIRLLVAGEPMASTTQRWVHVRQPDLKPVRAVAALRDAFGLQDIDPDVELPAFRPAEGPTFTWSFDVWHTWMDPLDHANHPAYVEWAEEALAQRVVQVGRDPHQVMAIAERVIFRSGVRAGERVTVTTTLMGLTEDGAAVTRHEIRGSDDRLCADAILVRILFDDPEALAALLT